MEQKYILFVGKSMNDKELDLAIKKGKYAFHTLAYNQVSNRWTSHRQ
jgi:hypothetical protein